MHHAITWFDPNEMPYGFKLRIEHQYNMLCSITRQFQCKSDRDAAIDIAEACLAITPGTLPRTEISNIASQILFRGME